MANALYPESPMFPASRLRCRLKGQLIVTTIPRLRGLLHIVQENDGMSLDVDMAEVEFIDSNGLALLLALQLLVVGGGAEITFSNLRPNVRRALDRMGANTITGTQPQPRLHLIRNAA